MNDTYEKRLPDISGKIAEFYKAAEALDRTIERSVKTVAELDALASKALNESRGAISGMRVELKYEKNRLCELGRNIADMIRETGQILKGLK